MTVRGGAICGLLLSAVVAAQEPEVCVGDCAAAHEQVAAAAARIAQDRNQFVAAVRQLIQAIPGRDIEAPSRIAASVDEMSRALTRWDQSLRTYRSIVLDKAGSADGHVAVAAAYLERGSSEIALKEARTAGGLDPSRADAWILQALGHDLAGHPAEAARAFENAAKAGRSSPAAVYGLAQRLIASGDESGAAAALRRFATSTSIEPAREDTAARGAPAPFIRAGLLRQQAGVAPLFPPATYARGFVLLADGAFDAAVTELRGAAGRDVARVRDLSGDEDIRQGTAALGRADLQAAIERLRAAVERWPGRAEPRQLLGLAYQADEQYERSIEQLTTAVRLNPGDEIGRGALGDVLVAAGRTGDAEAVLRSAPESGGGLHYQLALLYQSLARNGEAILELERAAASPPVVGQDHLFDLLGVIYTSDANLDGALGAYRRRVLVNPNDSDAHRKLGQIYLEQSRPDEASAEFTAALLLDPDNVEARAGRAQVFLRAGEYQDAAKWARRALALAPSHAAAQYALGTSLMRLGQTDQGAAALDEFRRLQAAAQSAADEEWALKLLKQAAQASIDDGDLDGAAVTLSKVLARQPGVAANHLNLGIVLERAGRYDAAVEQYRAALALSGDANVHGRLAAAYRALGRERESDAEQSLYERSKQDRLRARGFAR